MFKRLGTMWKLAGIVNKIPVVNFIPVLTDALNQLPAAYNSMSDEEKATLAKNLLLAASKAAGEYGSK